jgi:RNA polymerase sigma-70 factor, ECF subfamily
MSAVCLGLARRFAADSYAAEDVAQEALLRAWRHRDSLRSSSRREQWLAQIVRNEASRRFQKSDLPPTDQSSASGAEDPMLLSAGARLDLRLALDHLDRSERQLLRLRYEQDLTQPVIARLLGMPEGTVKVRLHRARAKLARAIRDE